MRKTKRYRSLSSQLPAFTLLGSFLVISSSCSDFKRTIGSEKSSPDEFAVVVRPPLSLPPKFRSRPAGKDTDTAAVAASNALSKSKLILNQGGANATSFDDLFDFDQIEDDIRVKVDEETTGIRF